jgi:hypothetical protein
MLSTAKTNLCVKKSISPTRDQQEWEDFARKGSAVVGASSNDRPESQWATATVPRHHDLSTIRHLHVRDSLPYEVTNIIVILLP